MTHLIVTNNPRVQARLGNFRQEVCESYLDVLVKARNMVHDGARLRTHPMSGSVKPWETPYRSVVLEECEGTVDFRSLEYIESALERYRTLVDGREMRQYPKKVLDDFQLIDYQLLISGLEGMGVMAGVKV